MTLKNIDLDWKRTEEYKDLYRQVKTLCPKMPDYLADLCIWAHKNNPKMYRDKEPPAPAHDPNASLPRENGMILIKDGVKIYNADEQPPVSYAPGADPEAALPKQESVA